MEPKLRQPGVFGQLSCDTYTVIVLGFPDQPGTSRDVVLATLDSSASRLLTTFPFLAGQVVKRGQTATNSGTYEIIPYPPHQHKSPVRRKDCTKLCPSYDEIARADAPFALLDGDVISPMQGIGYHYEDGTETPVFIVQANFIKGGLLLCFASMHNALDMNGQGMLLNMFATAGRGQDFDPALVDAGNRDADTIVPFLRPGEPSRSHDSMRKPSSLGKSASKDRRPRPCIWSYWRLPAHRVIELKKTASSGRSWVSTNDALTAFFIQRLTSVRVEAGRVAANEPVQVQRAVNARPRLDPPVEPGYMGHLVAMAETKWNTAKELCDATLADAALYMRESLCRVDDHFIRSLATLINDTEDKTTIFYAATNKTGRDFLTSSWAQLDWLPECDFGQGLGTPGFVRRPRLADSPDLTYIMPKNKNGDVIIASCLFHEDHVGLVNDDVWRQRVLFVG